jgi:hypothetical protein
LTAHFGCSLQDSYGDSNVSQVNGLIAAMAVPSFTTRRQVIYKTRKFNATLDYSYNVRNLSSLSDETAALLDALGIFWSPAIIWNAIPWSFVIDWVLGVSRWLDQFKTRNLEPVTNIYQYCWSYHIRREIVLSCGYQSVTDILRFTEETYKRQVVVPDYVRAFSTSGLNSREFSLAAALGLSRL